MSYTRCDDEFEDIEEFTMPLDILGAETKNNKLFKKENVK